MHVTIRKDGLWYSEYDDVVGAKVTTRVVHPFRVLRRSASIADDVTLSDIFRIVDSYPDLIIFLGDYSGCDVLAFHEEARQAYEPTPGDVLTHLEICRVINTWHTYFDDCCDFSGVGPGLDYDDNNMDDMEYSVSMTPVYKLAHLFVRTISTMTINDVVKETTYSLLDILDAIYWDLSFYGSPPQRDMADADLCDAADACVTDP